MFRYVLKVVDTQGSTRWFFLWEKHSLTELQDYITRHHLQLIYRLRIPLLIINIYKRFVRSKMSADMYKNLSLLLSADIPLLETLNIAVSSSNGRNKKLLTAIKCNLEMGYSFSKSLMVAGINEPFAQNLVQAGEKIGQLSHVMEEIAVYKHWQQEIKSKLLQSLAYPFFLALMICVVLLVLMHQLVPQLIDFYDGNGITIPSSLKFLLVMESFFSNNGLMILVFIAAIAICGILLIKNTKVCRNAICRIFLNIPLLGTIYSLSYLTRFYKNLSLQLSNSVDLIQALRSLQETQESYCYPDSIQKTLHKLEAGDTLSVALQSAGLLRRQDTNLLNICEKTGKITQGILFISTKTSKELQQKIIQFTEGLRPALILLFGSILGVISYAVFVPMYESISLIQ